MLRTSNLFRNKQITRYFYNTIFIFIILINGLNVSKSHSSEYYTKSRAIKDSEGSLVTFDIPLFISEGGILERGEKAIYGKGLEKTLYHQEHRQKIYKKAFSELIINAQPNEYFDNSYHEFQDEVKRLFDYGEIALHQYNKIMSTINLAAQGLNLKYIDGSTKFTKVLNKAKSSLRKVRKSGKKFKEVGDILTYVLAAKDFTDIIYQGLESYERATSDNGIFIKKIEAIQKHYIDKAGSLKEANKKYPAEMKALAEVALNFVTSHSLGGAMRKAMDENKLNLLNITYDVTATTVSIKYGAILKGFAAGHIKSALVAKYGVAAGKMVAAGGVSLCLGAIALKAETAIFMSQYKQGQDAQLATIFLTIANDFREKSKIKNQNFYDLLSSYAGYRHNFIMEDVTNNKLGKFRDWLTPETDNHENLDSYGKWNNFYKKETKINLNEYLLLKDQELQSYKKEGGIPNLFWKGPYIPNKDQDKLQKLPYNPKKNPAKFQKLLYDPNESSDVIGKALQDLQQTIKSHQSKSKTHGKKMSARLSSHLRPGGRGSAGHDAFIGGRSQVDKDFKNQCEATLKFIDKMQARYSQHEFSQSELKKTNSEILTFSKKTTAWIKIGNNFQTKIKNGKKIDKKSYKKWQKEGKELLDKGINILKEYD